MLLDTANGQCSHKVLEEKELSKLTGAELSQELYSNPQVCVYYDAWANDQDEDPLLSLVSEILLGINERYHGTEAFTHGRNLRDLAGSIIELITGRNVKGIQETVSGKDYLKQIEERRNLQEKVNEFLDNVTNERGNRLVIFIDELDRCSPVFAVRCKTRPIGTRVIAVDGTPQAGQTARHRLGIIGRRDSVSASFFLVRSAAHVSNWCKSRIHPVVGRI